MNGDWLFLARLESIDIQKIILLIEKVGHTIALHNLLKKEGRVVVAVSGGADSVALLNVLVELKYDCIAAHCNFHLRGEESNRDMRFVEQLTERLGIDLYIKDFNVPERMKMTGESIEMACRALRYNWFQELLVSNRAQAIGVGHHREDQVETFFINLLRGSGIAGLSGMKYYSNNIIRPLLDCSRNEIEEYLKSKRLTWINDTTNFSDDFLRNRIRNRILPYIERIFPDFTESVVRSMSILQENEYLYSHLIYEKSDIYRDKNTGEINIKELSLNEKYPGALLFEMIKNEGFKRAQIDDMLMASHNYGGTFKSSNNHYRDLDHGILRASRVDFSKLENEIDVVLNDDIEYPILIQITHHDVKDFSPERDNKVIYIDEKVLKENHRWKLRHWRKGDRIKPYGMTGSKLVSDVFAEAKLSSKRKKEIWLLTCDDEIVWIVGLRSSRIYNINPSTKNYIRLKANL